MNAVYLLWTTAAISTVAVVLFITLFVVRWVDMAGQKRIGRQRERLQPLFTRVVFGEADMEEVKLECRGALNVAEMIILEILRDISGDGRDNLLQAARELGLVKRNLRNLDHWDWARRDIAAMRLGIYALEDTVPALVKRLHDSRVEVRYSAARSLGIIDTPEAAEALVAIFDQPRLLDTPRVLEIVQTMESRMSDPLRKMLNGSGHPEEIKLLAIDLIGDLQDNSLADVLANLLYSGNQEYMIRALKALGKLSIPRLEDRIIDLATADTWELRAQACKTIGMLKIEQGMDALVQNLGDEAYWVRRNAAEALLAFDDVGARLLENQVAHKDAFARDIVHYHLQKHRDTAFTGEAAS